MALQLHCINNPSSSALGLADGKLHTPHYRGRDNSRDNKSTTAVIAGLYLQCHSLEEMELLQGLSRYQEP